MVQRAIIMNLQAFKTFGNNVDKLMALFAFFDGRIRQYNEQELPQVLAIAKDVIARTEPSTSISEFPELALGIGKHISVQEIVDWQFCWYVVMYVTIAESFLRDALAEAAVRDASFMEHSIQSLNYSEVLNGSVDALATSMRDRWAKKFVDSGGPSVWLQKLSRWGVRELDDGLRDTLEEMWGIRHVVVHRSGKPDEEFRRRHPGIHLSRGSIRLASEDVARYGVAVIEFAGRTDKYLRMRCDAKNTTPAT
jgi:hypothetical protein